MDENARLDALRERKVTLEETIADIDRELDRALYAVAAGQVDYALRVLESRRKDHAEFMFELGMVTARIEDMENRMHERDERGRENATMDAWQERAPVADAELDWLLKPDDGRQGPTMGKRAEERAQEDERDWPER